MTESLSFLLGLLLPPIVEFIKTKFANNKAIHYSIALILSAGVGILSTAIDGKLNTDNLDCIVGSIAIAATTSQSVYNYYWRDSKLARQIEDLRK